MNSIYISTYSNLYTEGFFVYFSHIFMKAPVKIQEVEMYGGRQI